VLPEAFVEIMVCPRSKQPLIYFPRGEGDASEVDAFLVCPASRLRYRIDEVGVPVLMVDEATQVSSDELIRLVARARQLGLHVP
jgi:uncharacterized protein YbaR (Trm112 family)